MLTKLAKAFALLSQDYSALKGDVQRLEKVRPVVKHGKDGVSPDPEEIVSAVLERIPAPKDGVSPDPQAIAEAAAKLVPEAKPGRDAIPPTARDVADVVLAQIEKPKDGVSPDPKAIAAEAAKLIPAPKDGVSPTPESVAKKMPNPQRGKTGAPGKNGVSVTDVQLNDNELFVFLDGKKNSAGKIKLPAVTAPFRPGGEGGGGGAAGGARTIHQHDNLAGLQGGSAGDYQHLTTGQVSEIATIADSSIIQTAASSIVSFSYTSGVLTGATYTDTADITNNSKVFAYSAGLLTTITHVFDYRSQTWTATTTLSYTTGTLTGSSTVVGKV